MVRRILTALTGYRAFCKTLLNFVGADKKLQRPSTRRTVLLCNDPR